jgi:hypothetical protein
MKKVADIWVVLIREPDSQQYTQIVANRDSAEAWIAEDMEETVSDCGDEDEIKVFQALTTVAQRLYYVADMFSKVYEIEMRDVLGVETTMDLLKEAVSDHHPVPEGS